MGMLITPKGDYILWLSWQKAYNKAEVVPQNPFHLLAGYLHKHRPQAVHLSGYTDFARLHRSTYWEQPSDAAVTYDKVAQVAT